MIRIIYFYGKNNDYGKKERYWFDEGTVVWENNVSNGTHIPLFAC